MTRVANVRSGPSGGRCTIARRAHRGARSRPPSPGGRATRRSGLRGALPRPLGRGDRGPACRVRARHRIGCEGAIRGRPLHERVHPARPGPDRGWRARLDMDDLACAAAERVRPRKGHGGARTPAGGATLNRAAERVQRRKACVRVEVVRPGGRRRVTPQTVHSGHEYRVRDRARHELTIAAAGEAQSAVGAVPKSASADPLRAASRCR